MSPSRPQILCIDDDPSTSRWIDDQLRRAGVHCEITAVASGREGFRSLNSEEYDLCVVEYALPDMTGVQLCALMRQMGSLVPMLFFTPMDRAVDRENADRAGAAGYLIKPDDADLFVDTATHLLKRRNRVLSMPPRIHDLARAA